MIPAPIAVPAATDAYYGLALLLLLLAPLAIVGLALVNTGLGRSRSAAQAILGDLVVISVAVIAFALFGAAIAGNLAGVPGGTGHSFNLAGRLRFRRSLRCCLKWPVSRLPPSFPGAVARTAGGSRPVARQAH
jgi:hypothetical protein